ncbi:uncharacterized protein LOC143845384 [Tasmannia lanceolata]|uniref:uncharacterized protein LOC143845384 n=1 Tax=Tasmannia lanceolata TaxID=3420 RepID=UPI0040639642
MAFRRLFSQRRNLLKLLQQPLPLHVFSLIPQNPDGFALNKVKAFKFARFFSQTILSDPSPLPLSEHVNDLCRVLSDFRSPHHDIESALNPFSSHIAPNLVEQVLKRCRNLGLSAHRFFIWAHKLPNFIPSRESYHILVDILGKCKQFPLIWDFLSEMKNGGFDIRPEIFWVIFRAYSRANLPMDVIKAFEKMGDFGIEPSVDDLDKLLSFLCKNNLVTHAQEFFDKVKVDFPIGAKTYSILMKGWGDCGNSLEAMKLFDEMLERDCTIDVVAYNTLLTSLCQGGKSDEAYKLFREMKSRGLEPNACTYATFIRASCEANDVHSAVRILDRVRRYGLVLNVFTYNCVIKLFCKNEKVDDAYLLLDEMTERGVGPDIWCYNAILAAHCNLREVNQALRLLRRMKKGSCLPDRHTYNMLLKMLIDVGRIDRAMEVWDGMGEMGFYPSVTTYAVMIHGLCKKRGRIEDVCRYFEMMIDEGIPPYSCTCDLLRDRLLRLGLREKIHILSDKMQQSTSCSIQELSELMSSPSSSAKNARIQAKKGNKYNSRSNGEEINLDS